MTYICVLYLLYYLFPFYRLFAIVFNLLQFVPLPGKRNHATYRIQVIMPGYNVGMQN